MVALAEGWFAGVVAYLVTLALATAALLVWPVPAAMGDRVGAALVALACAYGGGRAARRHGHQGLIVGLVTGGCVAVALMVPFLLGGHAAGVWHVALGAGAGGLGGAIGVGAGETRS